MPLGSHSLFRKTFLGLTILASACGGAPNQQSSAGSSSNGGSGSTSSGSSAGDSTTGGTSTGGNGGSTGSTTGAPAVPAVAPPSCLVKPTAMDTSAVPAPSGTSRHASTGDELQAALDAAVPGDEIVLAATGSYQRASGAAVVLPAKAAGGWIWIHSDQVGAAGFPAAGTRVTPEHAAMLPKLLASTDTSALVTAPGASHYWVTGVEIRPAPSASRVYTGLVELGNGVAADPSGQASDIVLDRVWIHGNTSGEWQRGIMMNGARLALIHSRVDEIHTAATGGCSGGCREAQGIIGWNGPGPYKIEDNYIAASTEGLMFGGARAQSPAMIPSDITITRNHFHKPASWKGAGNLVKDLLELKNAQRVEITSNLFENTWSSYISDSSAIVFTVRNQENDTPFAVIRDVSFANNVVTGTQRGIGILTSDDTYSSQAMQCVWVFNNLWDRLGADSGWGGDGRWATVLSGRSGGGSDLVFQHNTVRNPGQLLFVGDNSSVHETNTNFRFESNLGQADHAGLGGDGTQEGNATIARYMGAGFSFVRNDLVGGNPALYPPGDAAGATGNVYSANAGAVGFTDAANRNWALTETSPDHLTCQHKFDGSGTPHDIGVIDWGTAGQGLGIAQAAKDARANP